MSEIKKQVISNSSQNEMSAKQKALSVLKNSNRNSKTTRFDDVIGVFLGVEPRIHYPKIYDEAGNKVTEIVNGRSRDKRNKVSDGWIHYFNELGTGKIVGVVLPQKYHAEIFELYSISGLGYYISDANTFFLEKETKLEIR